MPCIEFRRVVPYPRPTVFDVVADVERYPAFVPGCRRARVLQRAGDRLLVEQELGFGIWSWTFRTHAVLDRPRRISIETREPPFSRLDQRWDFRDLRGDGTAVSLRVEYELCSPVLRRLATRLFDEGFRRTLAAFEGRIRDQLEPGRTG